MQDKNIKIHILYHLYYEESLPNLDSLYNFFDEDSITLSINLNQDITSLKEVSGRIRNKYPKANIITSPNIGKDVGGKLALMDFHLKMNIHSDYILLLHDKKSPQSINGQQWNNDLLKITDKKNLNHIFKLFKTNTDVGIICSKECISNEYKEQTNDFETTNNEILKNYINKFNLKVKDYSFVAGNMFWIRSSILEDFFTQNNPIEIRSELEKGNVLDNLNGTSTHSLERVFSWLASSQGYQITSI